MAVRAFDEPSTSVRLGRYEVVSVLGRGGMGIVHECRHTVLGKTAAIKVLHPHLAQDSVAAARFLREGKIAARVRHPNVVEVFDVGEHEGVPYLVMELVEGDDLATHFRQRSPMSIAVVVDCVLGVLAGVAAAHEAGIVHRDLKPSNIRLSADHLGEPRPKVLDFGISKTTTDVFPSDLTDTNTALGTTRYMAPEQLRSAKHADSRSDVYALGLVLYEGLTGRLPFDGSTIYEHVHSVLLGKIPPPRALRADIAPALEAIVLRALQHAPEARFSSAREFGQALADFASDPTRWRREFASRSRASRADIGRRDLEAGGAADTLSSATGFDARRPTWLWAALAATAVAGGVATVSWRVARHPTASPSVPLDTRSEGEGSTRIPIEPRTAPLAGAHKEPEPSAASSVNAAMDAPPEELHVVVLPPVGEERVRLSPSPSGRLPVPSSDPPAHVVHDLYDHM